MADVVSLNFTHITPITRNHQNMLEKFRIGAVLLFQVTAALRGKFQRPSGADALDADFQTPYVVAGIEIERRPQTKFTLIQEDHFKAFMAGTRFQPSRFSHEIATNQRWPLEADRYTLTLANSADYLESKPLTPASYQNYAVADGRSIGRVITVKDERYSGAMAQIHGAQLFITTNFRERSDFAVAFKAISAFHGKPFPYHPDHHSLKDASDWRLPVPV